LRRKILPLNDQELNEKLRTYKSREGMPPWWVPEVHDKALLRGANDYGWGRWEALCAEPKYPFRVLSIQKMKEAGVNTAEYEKATTAAASTGETKEEAMEVDEEKREKAGGDEEEEGEEKRLFAKYLNFPRDKILWKRVNLIAKLFGGTEAQSQLGFTSATATSPASSGAPEGAGVIKDLARKRKRGKTETTPATPPAAPTRSSSSRQSHGSVPAFGVNPTYVMGVIPPMTASALVADEGGIESEPEEESSAKRTKLNSGAPAHKK